MELVLILLTVLILWEVAAWLKGKIQRYRATHQDWDSITEEARLHRLRRLGQQGDTSILGEEN